MFSKKEKEKVDFVLDDTIDWWSKYHTSRGSCPPNQVRPMVLRSASQHRSVVFLFAWLRI
jgi:hypothetical protein